MIGAGGTISDRGDGGEGAARQAERLREGKRGTTKCTGISYNID